MKSKDIKQCKDCPLYKKDCTGWCVVGGIIKEPPCTCWDDEDEIYEGMYEEE